MDKSLSRLPALKKDINDLTSEDSRVQILGTVIDYVPGIVGDSNSLSQMIISDGTAEIKVFIDEIWDREYNIKEKVRVFGTIIPNKNEKFDLNAEIIQDMNALDIDLYNQIRKFRNNK